MKKAEEESKSFYTVRIFLQIWK